MSTDREEPDDTVDFAALLAPLEGEGEQGGDVLPSGDESTRRGSSTISNTFVNVRRRRCSPSSTSSQSRLAFGDRDSRVRFAGTVDYR